MKTHTIFPGHAVRRLGFALVCTGALFGHPALAERLGTPVWDVGSIPSAKMTMHPTYIGVYGDVLVQNDGLVIIRDRADHKKSIRVDMSRLAQAERRGIDSQCSRRACSEILMGFIGHGRLIAVSSGLFRSPNLKPASATLVAADNYADPELRQH